MDDHFTAREYARPPLNGGIRLAEALVEGFSLWMRGGYFYFCILWKGGLYLGDAVW